MCSRHFLNAQPPSATAARAGTLRRASAAAPYPRNITEISHKLGNKVRNLSLLEPTLEDVFIHYTGRGLRDAASEEYQGYKVPSMMR